MPVQVGKAPVATLLGDSLVAGYGLAASEALPAQLRIALHTRGIAAVVRNAGVSGDTTAAGARRVRADVGSDSSICVVALGANDLLQGIAPAAVERNLAAILSELRARRTRALLASSSVPFGVPRSYAHAFEAVFLDLALRLSVPLAPRLLQGVAGRPALLQADRLHPNAAGVRLIADRLAAVLAPLLRSASR